MVKWSELNKNEQYYLDWSWEKPEFWREIQYEPEEGDDETNSYNQHLCITGDEGAIDHEIKTKDEWEWYSREEGMDWNQENINRLINQIPIPMIGGRIKSTRKHKTTRRKTTRRKTTRRKTTRRMSKKRRKTKRKNTRRRRR